MIIKGQSTSNNRFVCKMSFICQMTKAIDYDLQFAAGGGGGGHHELIDISVNDISTRAHDILLIPL